VVGWKKKGGTNVKTWENASRGMLGSLGSLFVRDSKRMKLHRTLEPEEEKKSGAYYWEPLGPIEASGVKPRDIVVTSTLSEMVWRLVCQTKVRYRD
jgi:hypothetical protein